MTAALTFLSHFGACAPQPASDWQGPAPLPSALVDFYDQIGPLGEDDYPPRGVIFEAGGNDVLLPRLADLWQTQDGFGWKVRSSTPVDGWPAQWWVLATEGLDAFIYDADADAMRFLYSDDDVEDALEIAGTPADVMGALALFALRLEEAGDSAMDEDFNLLPEWVGKVRAEMQEAFGDAAAGVMATRTDG